MCSSQVDLWSALLGLAKAPLRLHLAYAVGDMWYVANESGQRQGEAGRARVAKARRLGRAAGDSRRFRFEVWRLTRREAALIWGCAVYTACAVLTERGVGRRLASCRSWI